MWPVPKTSSSTPSSVPKLPSRATTISRALDTQNAYLNTAATGPPPGTSSARTASTRPPASNARRAISSTMP